MAEQTYKEYKDPYPFPRKRVSELDKIEKSALLMCFVVVILPPSTIVLTRATRPCPSLCSSSHARFKFIIYKKRETTSKRYRAQIVRSGPKTIVSRSEPWLGGNRCIRDAKATGLARA